MSFKLSILLALLSCCLSAERRFPSINIPDIGGAIRDTMTGKCACGRELIAMSENVTKILQKLDKMEVGVLSLAKAEGEKVEKDEKIDTFLRSGIYNATNAMKKAALNNFVKESEKIKQEYESVPEGQYYRWDVGKRPDNFPSKHRYDFSKAYDHNRVVLKVFADNVTATDYINANYIDGYDTPKRFIATQAPIPATVVDHWRMIMDSNAAIIVTLTRLVENNKTKSEKYWADNGTAVFGDIEVTTVNTEKLPNLDIRQYSVKKGEETRDVRHFHFLGWPDTGTPTDPKALLDVISRVRSSENYKPLNPVVVHCSAGVGRTGTFILLFTMVEMAEKTGEIDVYKHFAKLRTQRVNAIETLDQYAFVYNTLLHVS